jgi:hypothetical protein
MNGLAFKQHGLIHDLDLPIGDLARAPLYRLFKLPKALSQSDARH